MYADGQGASGTGSSLESAAPYIQFVEAFIRANEIQSVVDFGCGDWTFSRTINWGKAHYMGIDVVKSVIERNQALYSTPGRQFIHADGISFDLPPADLLLCKDVLQHLTEEDIFLFLEQIKKFKHCLITNDVDHLTWSSTNPPIQRGGARPIDLTKPPFNIPGVKVLTYNSSGYLKQVLYVIHAY